MGKIDNEYTRTHHRFMTSRVKVDEEEANIQCRRGYIKGGHAYDAGISPHALPDSILTEVEEKGWWMGWQSRYASEQADLEPSTHGVLDGKVPYDWYGT